MMEWNVKNALNRNVEREQLNKILKEIRQAISSNEQWTQADIRRMVEEAVTSTAPPSASSITVTLTGDAIGVGSGSTSISIPVILSDEARGIEEAPIDSSPYWRVSGQWQNVPIVVYTLSYIEDAGLVSYDPEEGWKTDEPPEDGKYYARKDGAWEEVQVPTSGGVLPVVTGEIVDGQPVFVYLDDGSLVYTEI